MTITIPSSFTQGDILVATGSSTVSVLNATTSGFVLTSNGAGTQPSWQAIPGDGIWIKELTNDIHYDLGDIGIGISTPEEILHAFKSVGDIALKVETSALNGDSGLHLKNDAREWKLMIDGSDDDTFKITDITGSNIPLIINTSGKIGIDGTPTQKLDIHERSASPLALRLNQDNVVKQNVGIRLDRQGSETWFAGMNATDDKYILRQGGTTELLTVDTSGNVDISGDLKVNSDNYIPLTLSRNNSALNSGLGIKFDHLNSLSNMVNYSIIQDKIVDNTSGSEDGQIDFYTRVAGTLTKHLSLVAGNIGIGDTPEANTKLHLKFSDTNNPPLKIENQAVNSSAILSLKNDAREYILYNHGQDSDKLKIRDQTAGVDRIMLDTSGNLLVNSGNIGIGAAAASYNGRGNLLSIGNGVATMPGFVLKPASAWNTNSGWEFYLSATAPTHNKLVIANGSNSRLTIDENGNVIVNSGKLGIGIAPTEKLHVSGTAHITDTLTTGGSATIGDTLSVTTIPAFVGATDLYHDGGMLCVSSSSVKAKTNIIDTRINMDTIMKFRFRDFDFIEKNTQDSREFGLIAEELKEALPLREELIIHNNDNEVIGINYSHLGRYALLGVQLLYNKISLIEEKLKRLS